MKVRSEVDLLQVAKTLGHAVSYNQANFFNLYFVSQASGAGNCDELEIRQRGLVDLLNSTARQGLLDLAKHINIRLNMKEAVGLSPIPVPEPTTNPESTAPKRKPRIKQDTTPITITLPAHLAKKFFKQG